MKCSAPGCGEQAVLSISATYDRPDRTDPINMAVKIYPMPMYQTCFSHLPDLLNHDLSSPAGSRGYLIEPLEN